VLLGTATVVFGAGLMATAGYLISRAAERPAVLTLTVAIVAVRFFGLARPIARYLERLASHDFAFRVLARVRVRVYERIEPLAPVELDGYRRGDLLSRMVGDVDALQNLHLRGLQPPLVALASGAVCVGVAAAIQPAAGLVLAAGLLTGGIAVPLLTGSVARRVAGKQAAARGELTAELVELLQAASELVVYGREREQFRRVEAADRRLVRIGRRDALAAGIGDGLQLVVVGATVGGVLALAIAAHADGRLDRVLIAALALLTLASFEAVQPLAAAARELGATLAAGGRVLELVDREPRIVDPVDPAPAPSPSPTVSLEDVGARYSTDEPLVLDGACLRLEPGCRVALVGESGAGKTTITNLLLRFLDPERGRVTFGGRDVRELRQEDVRRAVAVAGQDAHLFSTSIRENIRMARPDAADDEVERVLRLVGALDWVEALPDGWDTLVGEQGRELSGGQRQRICVARALLARPDLLVLDEPVAHLDPPAASALIRDVFAAAGDAAVLLVTHRPEGLELVDEVLCLRDGVIAPA
jgi:ATP-binding cassette subfamily C protein CydC/ATP-binding cassette subfamily C protein CydCD